MKEKKKLIILLKVVLVVAFFLTFFSLIRSHLYIKLAPPKRVVCGTGLKKLNDYCMYYEHNERKLPASSNWCDLLRPYAESKTPSILEPVYQCPVDKIGPCSYAMNENITADAKELPGDLVLLFESAPGWNQTGGADDVVADRHGENNPGANIAFADGFVKFVPAEDIPTLRWTFEVQKRGTTTGSRFDTIEVPGQQSTK